MADPVPASFYDDLDFQNLPSDLKKEGSDWFAIFNPATQADGSHSKKRSLDVQLVHTLMHERCVPLARPRMSFC